MLVKGFAPRRLHLLAPTAPEGSKSWSLTDTFSVFGILADLMLSFYISPLGLMEGEGASSPS